MIALNFPYFLRPCNVNATVVNHWHHWWYSAESQSQQWKWISPLAKSLNSYVKTSFKKKNIRTAKWSSVFNFNTVLNQTNAAWLMLVKYLSHKRNNSAQLDMYSCEPAVSTLGQSQNINCSAQLLKCGSVGGCMCVESPTLYCYFLKSRIFISHWLIYQNTSFFDRRHNINPHCYKHLSQANIQGCVSHTTT